MDDQVNEVKQIKEVQDSIAWIDENSDVSHPLFHYTDMESIESILKSKTLWLSEYRDLDDKAEIAHGLDFMRLTGRWMPISVNEKDVLDDIDQEVRRMLTKKGVAHLFSFAKPDHLVMWRLYAANGEGLAIGFRKEFFEHKDKKHPDEKSFGSSRVFYEMREDCLIPENIGYVELRLQNTYRIAIKLLHQARGENNEHRFQEVLMNLATVLLTVSMIIKSPDYSFEEEYRIFSMADRDDQRQKKSVTVREKTKDIVEFEFDMEDVCEIMIGPASKHTKEDVEEMFKKLGLQSELSHIKITKSRHPYRADANILVA